MSEIDPSDPDAVRRQLDGLRAEFAGLGSGSGLLRGGAVSVFRELFGLAGTLSALVGSLQDKLTEEVAKNSALRDQIARYERQQYGRRSEKRRNAGCRAAGCRRRSRGWRRTRSRSSPSGCAASWHRCRSAMLSCATITKRRRSCPPAPWSAPWPSRACSRIPARM